jgi:hypothetical protein
VQRRILLRFGGGAIRKASVPGLERSLPKRAELCGGARTPGFSFAAGRSAGGAAARARCRYQREKAHQRLSP